MPNLSFIIMIVALGSILEDARAGSGIVLSEEQACTRADLVIIAEVHQFSDIPGDGKNPFAPDSDDSKWKDLGFKKSGKAAISKVLIGKKPVEAVIYGGKVGLGSFYRLPDPGTYCILLIQIDGNAYHPAGNVHGFMPMKQGKIGWPIDPAEGTRIWITPEEALKRIATHKEAKRKRTAP